ncbi:MAG TPA: hypothetical protein VG797_05330 [Phycisphaerales bacterium]|nr:hypothetical protein [Phycisphaerales bacterium]
MNRRLAAAVLLCVPVGTQSCETFIARRGEIYLAQPGEEDRRTQAHWYDIYHRTAGLFVRGESVITYQDVPQADESAAIRALRRQVKSGQAVLLDCGEDAGPIRRMHQMDDRIPSNVWAAWILSVDPIVVATSHSSTVCSDVVRLQRLACGAPSRWWFVPSDPADVRECPLETVVVEDGWDAWFAWVSNGEPASRCLIGDLLDGRVVVRAQRTGATESDK